VTGTLAPQLTLTDLFPPAALAAALADGWVRAQTHPTQPLTILNYTERAAYAGHWDAVTLACRGLVHHSDTGAVLARPFVKFFNHGQSGAPVIDLAAPVRVSDKLDGSLGILYPLPDNGFAVATRGSFSSAQARHATAVYQRRYADRFTPQHGVTVLFEIVYPQNRIVVDYGDMDDLLLLGAVRIADGTVLAADEVPGWPGPAARSFPVASFAQALALPPRPGAEGLVVRCLDTGAMVKLKQADYVALHRIVTGLTERTVWQHLVDGRPLADLVAPLPDEFHGWVHTVAGRIRSTVDSAEAEIRAEFAALPVFASRKDFALAVARNPRRWALFALLDGRDITAKLLHAAKPEGDATPSGRTFTEDNA
jgi:RNA ligase